MISKSKRELIISKVIAKKLMDEQPHASFIYIIELDGDNYYIDIKNMEVYKSGSDEGWIKF